MLTMSTVNDKLAIAFAASRLLVKMRYIGDEGTISRLTLQTSVSSFSARADLTTYAGDPDTAGRYTIGSGVVRRRSSTRTSSTTPMTVYHWLALAAGRTCLPIGSCPGYNTAAADWLMITLGVPCCS